MPRRERRFGMPVRRNRDEEEDVLLEPEWYRAHVEESQATFRATAALAETLIGLDEGDAEVQAKEAGCTMRVLRRDDELFLVSADLSYNRVNVEIVNGRVERAEVG